MPKLSVFSTTNPLEPLQSTQDIDLITQLLKQEGIQFEIWPILDLNLTTDNHSHILEAYQEQVERILKTYGFQSVEVINVHENTPNLPALRKKFLDEHIHTEDEVRFFVRGEGLFSLHINNKIFAILCDTGCFLAVPAGIKHWFDFGTQPNVTVIRFFTNTEGWIAQYTGEKIADQYPRLARPIAAKAIVVDIEGTIAPTDFVYNTLFLYAKSHLSDYIEKHSSVPAVQSVLEDVRSLIKNPQASAETIAQQLIAWIDADQKITPLKTLQGFIWKEGFEKGELKAPLYFDAFIQLNQWFKHGIPIYCYSSGSISAQELFYRYNDQGDVTYLFQQYFDTTIGNKLEKQSYQNIAAQLQQKSHDILFFSDNPQELVAAQQAGWQCVLVNRNTEQATEKSDYFTINDFRDVEVELI